MSNPIKLPKPVNNQFILNALGLFRFAFSHLPDFKSVIFTVTPIRHNSWRFGLRTAVMTSTCIYKAVSAGRECLSNVYLKIKIDEWVGFKPVTNHIMKLPLHNRVMVAW
jgi:hypothetical protein